MILEVMYKLFKVQLPIKVLVTCLHNFLENQSKNLRFGSLVSCHNKEITALHRAPRCPVSKDKPAYRNLIMSILPTQQSRCLGSQRLPRSQAAPLPQEDLREAGQGGVLLALSKHSRGQFVPQPGSAAWLPCRVVLGTRLQSILAEIWG